MPTFTLGKKNFRVGDLILLYWYNYIDLKVIKSSDIPVISGVVYDLGFCPKHAFMARINVREVGDTPTLQAGRPQSHPGLLQPPTLYICRTFRFALGHRNRTGSTLGAGHKVSPGLVLPMVCTILVGSPVSFLIPPTQQGTHEEGHSSPVCHEHLHGQLQSSQHSCHHMNPARLWLSWRNPLCPV